jgi:eukaryotic-like serine/threonine-protein kinase
LNTTSANSRAPANSAEATDDLQDRLGRFARFAFSLAATIFVAARVVEFTKFGALSVKNLVAPNWIAYEIALLILFLAWIRCRRSRMSRAALEAFDAALTIVVSSCWAMLGWGPDANYPVSLAMPLTHTLILRSVIVPSSFRRTLWISIVSAVPTVFIIATHSAFVRGAPFDGVRVFLAISWCCVAVAIAALNSRTLYGLRRQIADIGKLGQYTLEEKIGEGGMGVVYRATHAMLRRPAAIKLLLRDRASENDLARFEREVQLTSRLAHPNTVSIFDYGRSSEGVFYYVMEYLDGVDLDRLIETDGPLESPRAIHILAQASAALAEAHLLGLIHRDIKPANIVLTERADEPDVVKVVDFGLVRTLTRNQGDSDFAAAIIGTPLYLAPEAVTSPDNVDGRADLYALGAVAYFLLTGKNVFEAATVVEMCSKHMVEEPVSPSKRLGRPLSADLEALVLACLAKDRSVRPASATALREALLACKDAGRYDPRTSRAWWRDRGAALRASGRSAGRSGSSAPSMAIDLRGRTGAIPDARGRSP